MILPIGLSHSRKNTHVNNNIDKGSETLDYRSESTLMILVCAFPFKRPL